MAEERRDTLRRVDDVRQLLRFCLKFGQAVPSKVVDRLHEMGIAEAAGRPIPELLADLDSLEQPSLESLPADRRQRQRRWYSAAPEDFGPEE